MQTKSQRTQRGFTVVESVMVLTIAAITLGAGLPSLSRLQDRQRLQGAAAQLETELQFARNLAVAKQRPVRISFQATADQSCYVIHTGPANGCRCEGQQTSCVQAAAEIRTVRFEADSHLRATSNSSSILFDHIKGTVTPTATMRLNNARGDGVNLVVNIMGRVRSCSTTGMAGQLPC